MPKQMNILICPLNWGLGHATRCVPVIKKFLKAGANVIVAADKEPLAFLKLEFPGLQCVVFEGYNISYQNKGSFAFKMLMLLPSIIKGILKEHKQTAYLVSKYNIDIIISDNRYGVWNKKTKNIFITHQIKIISPVNFFIFNQLLYFFNRKLISKFNECWIPDFENKENLSGKLSHNCNLPINKIYIGPLSRFADLKISELTQNIDLLVIISGPEPQRSIFETLMIEEIQKNNFDKVIILRGLPGSNKKYNPIGNIIFNNHLNTVELLNLILISKNIIARAGYSTIMDMITLGKSAILIPTPGQTEQEYLAEYLKTKKYFHTIEQKNFNLFDSVKQSVEYKIPPTINDSEILSERINFLIKNQNQ